jgi:hypothetical protein
MPMGSEIFALTYLLDESGLKATDQVGVGL